MRSDKKRNVNSKYDNCDLNNENIVNDADVEIDK